MTLEVGDRIEILVDKLESADVKIGDRFTVSCIDLDGNYFETAGEFNWSFSTDGEEHGWYKIVSKSPVEKEITALVDNLGRIDTHYDFFYELTPFEAQFLQVKIDPYFVAKQWRIGDRDSSGILFHTLKTIARFGDKNSREREIKAMYLQVKRLAELEGVELE